MIVLGIDPRSRVTGFAIVEWRPVVRRLQPISYGTVKVTGALPERCHKLYTHGYDWAERRQSCIVAMEEPVVGKNAKGSIILAQARGAIITGVYEGMDISGYPRPKWVDIHPSTVKKLVSGNGRAKKPEMVAAVQDYFGLQNLDEDSADAIAIAVAALRQKLEEK